MRKVAVIVFAIIMTLILTACDSESGETADALTQKGGNAQQETPLNDSDDITTQPDKNNYDDIHSGITTEPATDEEIITKLFWGELGGYWALTDDETGEFKPPFFISFTYFVEDGEPVFSRMKHEGSVWSLTNAIQLNENEYKLDFKVHSSAYEGRGGPEIEYITCTFDVTNKDNGTIIETTDFGGLNQTTVTTFTFLAKTWEEAAPLMEEIWDSFLPPPEKE